MEASEARASPELITGRAVLLVEQASRAFVLTGISSSSWLCGGGISAVATPSSGHGLRCLAALVSDAPGTGSIHLLYTIPNKWTAASGCGRLSWIRRAGRCDLSPKPASGDRLRTSLRRVASSADRRTRMSKWRHALRAFAPPTPSAQMRRSAKITPALASPGGMAAAPFFYRTASLLPAPFHTGGGSTENTTKSEIF